MYTVPVNHHANVRRDRASTFAATGDVTVAAAAAAAAAAATAPSLLQPPLLYFFEEDVHDLDCAV